MTEEEVHTERTDRSCRLYAGFRCSMRRTSVVRLLRLPYTPGWQPRLPDPSYASPALVVVPEDKSGTALAWILPFHRDFLYTVARRRDNATGTETR